MANSGNKKRRRRRRPPPDIEGGLEHVLAMRLARGRRQTQPHVDARMESKARTVAKRQRAAWKRLVETQRAKRKAKRHPNATRAQQAAGPGCGAVEVVGGRLIDRLVTVLEPGEWYAAPDITALTDWSHSTRQAVVYQKGIAGGYLQKARNEGAQWPEPEVLFALTDKGVELATLNRLLD